MRVGPLRWLLVALVAAAIQSACAEVIADRQEADDGSAEYPHAEDIQLRGECAHDPLDPGIFLMQQKVTPMQVRVAGAKGMQSGASHPMMAGSVRATNEWGMIKGGLILSAAIFLVSLTGNIHPSLQKFARAVRYGGAYIVISSVMIESNKWLMSPGRFPYPITLTFNHMLSCTILAQLLYRVCPSFFPAMQGVEVTPRYCVKFLGLGIPFMLSTVCGNWAYKFLSVSFLQIMKQTNVITIYAFSVVVGLEALRRCSVMLLCLVLGGAVMAVHGELHFVVKGFVLQMTSSWSEATKVVYQSFLMSGQAKMDPLSLILFMAPCCFLANLVPWFILDFPLLSTIIERFIALWPLVVTNMLLAFVLNIVVAQCIRELSAVGFLLCGVVKDNCIVLTSIIFMGEQLTHLQQWGFITALSGVVLYSLYKQNLDCFKEDNLFSGFQFLLQRSLFGENVSDVKAALSSSPKYDSTGNGEAAEEDAPNDAAKIQAEPQKA